LNSGISYVIVVVGSGDDDVAVFGINIYASQVTGKTSDSGFSWTPVYQEFDDDTVDNSCEYDGDYTLLYAVYS